MSTTPRPPPTFNSKGERRFRHQVLGYPVTDEWLQERSMKLYGTREKTDEAAMMMATVPGFEHRVLRIVYAPKTDDEMICFPLADNSTLESMRRVPPKHELEGMRELTGQTGSPLWYDVAC